VRYEFPSIFAMALDYLPIQAASIPCERIFSSSAETDTSCHSRLSPVMFEALQMLKYDYKLALQGKLELEEELEEKDVEELTTRLFGDEANIDPLTELDKVAGDDFLKLLESLLDCDDEEPGDDVELVDAEEGLEYAEGTFVAADVPVLSY
jgi:hypothetical protein